MEAISFLNVEIIPELNPKITFCLAPNAIISSVSLFPLM
jgi:hypothetical protein